MIDEPDGHVLRHLRRIDETMGRVETRLSELMGRTGLLQRSCASISRTIDQIDLHIECLERRLDVAGEQTS